MPGRRGREASGLTQQALADVVGLADLLYRYASPDAHLCTIKDFADLVSLVEARVESAVAFNTSGQRLPIRSSISLQNLLGEKAVFLLSKHDAR